ncbi:MAG TPA: hypothetical protein VEX36_04420 [Thermoleophilaceae bacterium]|nr:hypothetical protein [Thermoleophilaceae bacterium]
MSRRRALWVSGGAAGALLVVLALLDARMQDTGGPGIVAFELAGTSERAAEIMAEWGEKGQDAARLSLWLDFPYLLAWGSFLALAVASVRDSASERGWARFARVGAVVVAFAIAAAACDAIEDVNLLLTLEGHGGSTAPALAKGFAIAKFALMTIAAIYVAAGLLAIAAGRFRRVA